MKNFFEKTKYQILFSYIFIQTYASLACKRMNFKSIYKVCIFQTKMESDYQIIIFHISFFHFHKNYTLNPNSLSFYANKPLAKPKRSG
jgi:hypothetical protein